MKKYMVLCAGLCMALAFTSCKSSESAYKKAYEKAKAQAPVQKEETPAKQQAQVNVVAPVQETPVVNTPVVDNVDNVQVRKESVSLVKGSGLKNFSVVVGSFGLISNAEGLVQKLSNNGYNAQIVKNTNANMYRVVAATFDTKAEAAASRDRLRSEYPDAWLLYNSL